MSARSEVLIGRPAGIIDVNACLPVQVLEDVSQEHARKTVTVETFPHDTAITAAAIHPCKHAVTMRKLSGMMEEGGKSFSVDQLGPFHQLLYNADTQ